MQFFFPFCQGNDLFFLKKKGQKNLHRNVVDRHSYFFSFQTSPDGNVTLSILNYVPTIRDAGKYMACRAENPELPDATLEDGWKLEIYCKFFLQYTQTLK